MKHSFMSLSCAVLFIAMAGPAAAQVETIDYYGYGWEGGGLPPSAAGDILEFACTADYVSPIFGVDLGTTELTFHVHDLVSIGEVDLGFYREISYSGGILDIYLDASMNADWGTFPPNATCPSTFTDGILYFRGSFTDFVLYLDSTGGGSFEGHLDGLAGVILNALCSDCAYTWGGAFTSDSGAQILDGFDLQIDGVFEIDRAVRAEGATWGQVKSLYR